MKHVHQVDCVDPCQILPVVCHGDRSQIVKSCIYALQLWPQIHKLQLSINMRVTSDETDFSAYVLKIGDGTTEHPEIGEDMIKVPPEYAVLCKAVWASVHCLC